MVISLEHGPQSQKCSTRFGGFGFVGPSRQARLRRLNHKDLAFTQINQRSRTSRVRAFCEHNSLLCRRILAPPSNLEALYRESRCRISAVGSLKNCSFLHSRPSSKIAPPGIRDPLPLASGKRGQQDHQRRDPQSHPDQEVFGASHFSSIHGKPLFQILLLVSDRATAGPRGYVFVFSDLANTLRAIVCQKISGCVFRRTQHSNTSAGNLAQAGAGFPRTSRSLAESIFMVKGLCTSTVPGFSTPSGANDGLA